MLLAGDLMMLGKILGMDPVQQDQKTPRYCQIVDWSGQNNSIRCFYLVNDIREVITVFFIAAKLSVLRKPAVGPVVGIGAQLASCTGIDIMVLEPEIGYFRAIF